MGITKKKIFSKNIFIKDVLNFKLIKYLPKNGFFKSRLSYIIIFILSIFKLHIILKKDQPDFIIIHLMTSIPLLLLLLFNYKTKFILRISGYPKLNFLRSFFWKIVGKKIYLITTPTKLTLNLLCETRIFNLNKIKYLPDPVLNLGEIKDKKNKKENIEKQLSSEITILSIGRLTHQKNFNFLIMAFKEINKKYPNLNLVILGDGEEMNKLKNLIKKINLEEKIFLVGYKKNVYDYLKNSKMFVLTSLWEDPGFVLIEAAYMNKTVLSSDCLNGPKELLENEKNGFLFKSNSLTNFLNKFEGIMNADKKLLFKKKFSIKKKNKEFTLLNHYKILNSLLIQK